MQSFVTNLFSTYNEKCPLYKTFSDWPTINLRLSQQCKYNSEQLSCVRLPNSTTVGDYWVYEVCLAVSLLIKAYICTLSICWLQVCYMLIHSVQWSTPWCSVICLLAASLQQEPGLSSCFCRKHCCQVSLLLAEDALVRNIWQYPPLKILSAMLPNQTWKTEFAIHFVPRRLRVYEHFK